ncbi:IS3 family transposase (plasmid) [Lactococcus sp. LG592]|nr:MULTISPECIES: IS3 family transposase [Lactococcus]QSR09870.1 IS3 family transposase [Lactococcus sp. LG592]
MEFRKGEFDFQTSQQNQRELINDAHFETRAEATQEIFKYIETYYNTKRMHSALDYKSPKDFEKYNS